MTRRSTPVLGLLATLLVLAGCAPGADYSHCKPEDFTIGMDRTAVCVRYSAATDVPAAR